MAKEDSGPRIPKELLATSRVIAKGRAIRDIRRLLANYGGKPSGWTKKSTAIFLRNRREFEYHWYEHHGIGRVEVKLVDLRARSGT